MYFKYHNGYKGYYLTDNKKYVKPFKKLNLEQTKLNLCKYDIFVKFDIKDFIEIKDEYVVFYNKETNQEKNLNIIQQNASLNFKRFEKYFCKNLFDYFLKFIINNEKNPLKIGSIFEILENIIYTDTLFISKLKEIKSIDNSYLKLLLEKYFPIITLGNDVRELINKNYPCEYVYEHLPLDYKETEMLYIFYFIVLIEFLSSIK